MKKTNMMKRRIFGILISTILVFTAGCGTQNSASGGNNKVQIELPDHVETQLNEKINVDAKVTAPLDVNGTLYSYQAQYFTPDAQELQDIFFQGEEGVKKEADEESGLFSCESADGKRKAYHYDNTVSFQSTEDDSYNKLISFCVDNNTYRAFPESFTSYGGVAPAEKLSFMTEEEAKQIVKDTADKMGTALDSEPYVFFVMDEAALTNLLDGVKAKLTQENSEEWAEEIMQTYLPDVDFKGDKGCYYMLWQQLGPHGEAIMSNNRASTDDFQITVRSYVMGIVNENGLASFYSYYNYQYTEENELADGILGVDEALDKIAQFYEKVPLSEDYQITKITLQYAAVSKDRETGMVEVVPAWFIETSEENYKVYVVDAVNGDII